MKRALSLLLAVACLVAFAPRSYAGHWVNEEIKWQITSVGSPLSGTAIYTRDTTYNVVAAGQTDTTGSFSLSRASRCPLIKPSYVATQVDTTTFAWLLFTPDSLGVSNPTLIAATVEIDGRVGGYGASSKLAGWTQVDSLVAKWVNNPAGGPLAVPIRIISSLAGTFDPENAVNAYGRITAYDNLRVRLTSVTGVMSACRAFVRYWVDKD